MGGGARVPDAPAGLHEVTWRLSTSTRCGDGQQENRRQSALDSPAAAVNVSALGSPLLPLHAML
jgi:hypothetical protein